MAARDERQIEEQIAGFAAKAVQRHEHHA